MKFLNKHHTSYITYININTGRKIISSPGTNTDNSGPTWRRFPLSDTRVAAVVVRNSPFHLFDVTGNKHLFRSPM